MLHLQTPTLAASLTLLDTVHMIACRQVKQTSSLKVAVASAKESGAEEPGAEAPGAEESGAEKGTVPRLASEQARRWAV